jgi:hypothetical protein
MKDEGVSNRPPITRTYVRKKIEIKLVLGKKLCNISRQFKLVCAVTAM